MSNQDPDVLRWGLNELCILSTAGSAGCVTQYNTDFSQVGYVNEGYQESFYENVDDDAAIAHTFQEELSRVAAEEASGLNDPSQVSVIVQNWLDPGTQNCSDGDDQNQGVEDMHTRSTNENERSNDPLTECPFGEDMLYSLEMTDESSMIDGEVGKRLNQMVPVPHIPKTNGEIPSADEEITDHQRLLERLQLYELVENKVQGDGNCQFRALSDQLYRSPDYHKFVRERVVSQLKSDPDKYGGYIPMTYDAYLKRMSKSGEWGDHVTLQAAADSYGVKIFVITSFKETCYVEILPNVQKSKRVIFLSFWAEVHYNSIYPEGELPVVVNKRKKKWWVL